MINSGVTKGLVNRPNVAPLFMCYCYTKDKLAVKVK